MRNRDFAHVLARVCLCRYGHVCVWHVACNLSVTRSDFQDHGVLKAHGGTFAYVLGCVLGFPLLLFNNKVESRDVPMETTGSGQCHLCTKIGLCVDTSSSQDQLAWAPRTLREHRQAPP